MERKIVNEVINGIEFIHIEEKEDNVKLISPKEELTNVLKVLRDAENNNEIGNDDMRKAIKTIEELLNT